VKNFQSISSILNVKLYRWNLGNIENIQTNITKTIRTSTQLLLMNVTILLYSSPIHIFPTCYYECRKRYVDTNEDICLSDKV